MELNTLIISLGGSIIVPGEIDKVFLKRFREIILSLEQTRFMIICGGGKICRDYQNVAKEIAEITKEDLDWIGIRATRLNAELVRAAFGKMAYEKVIHDPDEDIDMSKRIVIGAGFEPGSSTDLRTVQVAKRFGAGQVVNMSNIDYVYSDDPKNNPDAKKLTDITWVDFRKLVGNEWSPGLNMPFDPIASKAAEAAGLKVVIIGNDMGNLERLLNGKSFKGTTIS
ncbi:MAG: UMP kinase [Desulfobacterales bacterium]|nr:UMP kinase [Desulfobacterales bacterium]MBL7101383.1 UMP kinase [Desulfobacteraceae bacterium]MBL7172502.1 UMP kinase [Desulfobacteraceae bacterium]